MLLNKLTARFYKKKYIQYFVQFSRIITLSLKIILVIIKITKGGIFFVPKTKSLNSLLKSWRL